MDPETEASEERRAVAPRRAQKICVIMPAYNAEKTLERTWNDLPMDWVDDVSVVPLKTGGTHRVPPGVCWGPTWSWGPTTLAPTGRSRWPAVWGST